MLRFSEEINLLLLDDGGGTFVDLPPHALEFALAGAVLMDLALEGRIDTDPQRLFVVDPTPLGDDLLDPTLARIVASADAHDTAHWIRAVTDQADDIHSRSLDRLIERGILRREEDRFMWVFKSRRYPIVDNSTVREVKLRLMGVLFSEDIPDPRDTLLISLSDVCGIFSSLLSNAELDAAAGRIGQVRKLDLLGREVTSAVREIEASLARAVAMPMH
jgi:hypothetical protein